ncbi:outer membrane lipoprotein-sorting protein [Desulfobacterales bacterium HSG17]|nr:outer membrane lipoprotein-sorting protein [Desulfobacterales bacterium HSG17]
MTTATKRHISYPYVFEEQAVIMTDCDQNRYVRRMRRFSRIEANGSAKALLMVTDPPEVRGVAFLLHLKPDQPLGAGIYLPAYGDEFKQNNPESGSGRVLGTDFTAPDFLPTDLAQYWFERNDDIRIGKIWHFVVDAIPKSIKHSGKNPEVRQRHYIRRDIFFIVQTTYFNQVKRMTRRRTNLALKPVDQKMWVADMVLMEDIAGCHQTLIKVTNRIFSADYVPPGIFEPEFVIRNRRILLEGERLSRFSWLNSRGTETPIDSVLP